MKGLEVPPFPVGLRELCSAHPDQEDQALYSGPEKNPDAAVTGSSAEVGTAARQPWSLPGQRNCGTWTQGGGQWGNFRNGNYQIKRLQISVNTETS